MEEMKILVGLSGGVDSAVAAYLLKQQGYDLSCAFMRNWDSAAEDDYNGNPTVADPICPQEQDYLDAKAVADKLGIELLRIDFVKEYWDDVFHTFLNEYKRGRTPNPDILCNQHIKFGSFWQFAKENGFDTLATGHYARMNQRNSRPVLCKADDRNKDQSYFLCQVQRPMLDHILFPLGTITKPEVRRIAAELHLDSVARKKDSTGICFIGERRFREFLSNYLPMQPGDIINVDNQSVVGRHKGVLYYTMGQRKGLDIGGTGPYYVCGKDVSANELYVCDEKHQHWLYSDACTVRSLNWLADCPETVSCMAKFRYRQPDLPVRLMKQEDGSIRCEYPETIRSVTPGQEAVFYLDDMVLGGGVIDQVFCHDADLMQSVRNKAHA